VNALNKLVYLHAAICESLLFFPSVPFEHKYAIDMMFFPAATILAKVRGCCTRYTQWEGWKAYGVEIA
jgi:hypothetical protein